MTILNCFLIWLIGLVLGWQARGGWDKEKNKKSKKSRL